MYIKLSLHKIKSMSEEFDISETVDARGTRCPIPLIRAKQALKLLQNGEYLLVLATDPSAKSDFDAMLRHLPHVLVSHEQTSETPKVDTFIIRKGA